MQRRQTHRKGKKQQKHPKKQHPLTLLRPNFEKAFKKEQTVVLEFTYGSVMSAGAASYKTIRFTPNAAYDVDPVLGSTSTVGFAELAAMYSNYRVIEYSYSVTYVNKETFPVLVMVHNSNSDLGTGQLGSYMGNAFSDSDMISGSSGGPCRKEFRNRYTVKQIVGRDEVLTDDTYSALVTTVPADKVYLGMSVDGLGSTLTNGVEYLVKIQMKTWFYARKPLTS